MGEDLIRMVEGLMNEESPLARVAVKRRKAPPPPPKPKEKEEEKESIWDYTKRRAKHHFGNIGLESPLEEMSSMGAGAVEGGGVPNKKTLIREEEPVDLSNPDFDSEEAFRQSMEDEHLGVAKDAASRITDIGTELVPGGKAIKKGAGVAGDIATGVDVADKVSKGDTEGGLESTLGWVPGYDLAKGAAKTLLGQGFGSRGAGAEEGTPQRTAYSIRNQAKLHGKTIERVGTELYKNLQANPEVAKKAAEKGWISKNLYKDISSGKPPRKLPPHLSENQIKNHEEPIIEEVLNYLLGKMEIL